MPEAEGTQPTSGELDQVLRDRFGLASFRPMQREAIGSVLSGRDTLVVMPTGGGKSLCYQLPALLLPGITLVISPLIALMKDQVDRLQKLRVPASVINSTLSFNQMRGVVKRAQAGQLKVLFVAPERMESETFREELGALPISLLAIDEAHCISEWGHDFRTSYRRLPESFSAFAEGRRPPIMALTATATPEVRTDIRSLLSLRDPFEVITGFERKNLAYGVLRESEKESRVKDMLGSIGSGSAIVYAATRKSVESITSMLKRAGYDALSYHAGLQQEVRRRAQDRFLTGTSTLMVATSAFGMGVDKPDVRLVIHYDLPGSLEAYYQEAGRAGRDGEPAHAVLLFNNGDARVQEFLIRASSPTEAEIKSVYTALHDIAGNTYGSLYPGILQTDSAHILKRIVKPDAPLDRIIEVLEQAGYVKHYRSMTADQRAKVRFTVGRGRIEEVIFKSNSKPLKETLSALVRTTGSAGFGSETFVDQPQMLRTHHIDAQEFTLAIRTLESLGVLRYTAAQRPKPGVTTYHVALLGERIPPQYLNVGADKLQARLEANLRKLEQMIEYATAWSCRRNTILSYFGERPIGLYCGTCDVCTTRARSTEA